MNDRPSQNRDVIFEEELHSKIESGLYKTYMLAKASYGPKAGNALLEQNYGAPVVSRDGVTNVQKANWNDPIEKMASDILVQSSKRSNEKVGDGTTAVVILAYHLYKEAKRMVGAGMNRMEVAALLDKTCNEVLEYLDSIKKPVDIKLLKYVAQTSASDPELGELIYDVVSEIGEDGGVTIEDYDGVGISSELVDGFYFKKGYTDGRLINDALNRESTHQNVPILISDKRLATVTDIAPILDVCIGKGLNNLIIIGTVEPEALDVLLLNRMHGKINTVVVDLPYYAGQRQMYMDDMATMLGAKVYMSGANPLDFDISMLGAAEKVVITEYSTTIIGGDGNQEDVKERIRVVKEHLKEATRSETIDLIRDRLSKLTGKIAIIKVGGAIGAEQVETKLRVQDGVCAVQAAQKDGILPGGGTALAKLSDVPFANAFKQPFRQLMDNAGLNPESYLARIETSDTWKGFNLKNLSERPADMMKSGVLDPSLVIKEVVQNASSVASSLIKTSVGNYLVDRRAKLD